MDIFLSLLFGCAAFFGYLSSLHRIVEVQDNFYMGLGSYVLSTMLIAALTRRLRFLPHPNFPFPLSCT